MQLSRAPIQTPPPSSCFTPVTRSLQAAIPILPTEKTRRGKGNRRRFSSKGAQQHPSRDASIQAGIQAGMVACPSQKNTLLGKENRGMAPWEQGGDMGSHQIRR